jgi:hypothetical protein
MTKSFTAICIMVFPYGYVYVTLHNTAGVVQGQSD